MILSPYVRIDCYPHCNLCGHTNVVLWVGDCGCWASKCTLCGLVGYVDCGDEYEEHWDLFEEEAQKLV